MESSSSQNADTVPGGTNEIPIGNNSEDKTDDNKDSAQKSKEESSDSNKEKEIQADEIEKKDSEEKQRYDRIHRSGHRRRDHLNATTSFSENLAEGTVKMQLHLPRKISHVPT
ncbi:hypothetical protein EVAR_56078_1 [Eumeta japonica]|uniref:Uncharacterized protein n=1 Tax=Eumeta variegata TaxID=151549 RepID=A0A4C1YMU1_EUMVA|nr:hypothetical protein EVAR_56078_1 [Eumeta japonica]